MKSIFDLQLFTEGNPAGGPAANPSGEPKTAGSEPPNTEPKGQEPTKNTPKYTDDDLDKIIDKKFAKWQAEKQKELDEAKRLAEMDAAQKAEYERDKLQKELEGYKKKDVMSNMAKTARGMLRDKGITVSDELLSSIVTDDAETTKAAIDSFATAFSSAVEDAVKERLKGKSPQKGAGSTATLTKEQIMEIKDPVERQRLINENRELFGY